MDAEVGRLERVHPRDSDQKAFVKWQAITTPKYAARDFLFFPAWRQSAHTPITETGISRSPGGASRPAWPVISVKIARVARVVTRSHVGRRGKVPGVPGVKVWVIKCIWGVHLGVTWVERRVIRVAGRRHHRVRVRIRHVVVVSVAGWAWTWLVWLASCWRSSCPRLWPSWSSWLGQQASFFLGWRLKC